MEECPIEEEIKTETSHIEDTESEKFTVEHKNCIKSEEDLNSIELELAHDGACIKTEIEVHDKKPSCDQLQEIEDAVDSSIVQHSDCDIKDIGAQHSVKQECDYVINEELEIKNEADCEGTIINENSIQSYSDDTEDSCQSGEGVQNRTYNPENENFSEESSDGMNKFKGGKYTETGAEKQRKKLKECNLCNYTTKDKSNLKAHRNSVHLKKQFKCNDCDFSTVWSCSLRSHKKMRHPDQSSVEFKCSLCPFVTKYKSHLNTHNRCVHLRKLYKCSDCDFSAVWHSSLRSHRKSNHSSETDDEFKCDLCDYITKYKYNMKSHMDSVHLKIQYKCDLCDFSTPYAGCLRLHKKRRHFVEEEAEFKCDLCEFITKSKYKLSTHKHIVHLKIQYRCPDCVFSTAYARSLRKHRQNRHSSGS